MNISTQTQSATGPSLLNNSERRSFFSDGMVIVLLLAAANLLFHWYFNNQYGYFRDEFDYMACGDHLAWGYVDHPPLIPFLIKLCRLVSGDSLRSVRFIPALATSAAVILTAMMAGELGGRRFATVLAALSIVGGRGCRLYGRLLATRSLGHALRLGGAHAAVAAV